MDEDGTRRQRETGRGGGGGGRDVGKEGRRRGLFNYKLKITLTKKTRLTTS